MKKFFNINLLVMVFIIILKGELPAINTTSPFAPAVDAYSGLLLDHPDTPPWLSGKNALVAFPRVDIFSPVSQFVINPLSAPPPKLGRWLPADFFRRLMSPNLALLKIRHKISIPHKSSDAEPARILF